MELRTKFLVWKITKLWVQFFLITITLGIAAFILGHIIWPNSLSINFTPNQMHWLNALSLVESLLFGFGVAFFFLGWPLVNKASKSKNLTRAAFISFSWILVSWWPHDMAHLHNYFEPQGFLNIEYGFHLTVIIAALILAYYFLNSIKYSALESNR